MNYTQNYRLPQWEETDRVLMEDFNGAMANVEAGMTANAAAAAELPYAAGSYVGSVGTQHIVVGFRPSAVLIGEQAAGNSVETMCGCCSLFTGGGVSYTLIIEDTGFLLWSADNTYPSVNKSGHRYGYVAFR